VPILPEKAVKIYGEGGRESRKNPERTDRGVKTQDNDLYRPYSCAQTTTKETASGSTSPRLRGYEASAVVALATLGVEDRFL
jgi:hypothetical protein